MKSRERVLDFKNLNLSSLELAMLELTNGSSTTEQSSGRTITLLSKSAYLWAGVIEAAVRARQEISWPEFRAAIESSIKGLGDEIPAHYRGYDPSGPEAGDMRFFMALLEELKISTPLSDIEEQVRRAYSALLTRGLVEDPIRKKLKKGLAIAVLSLVPVSFSNVTRQGHSTSMTVNSVLIHYEKTMDKKGQQQIFEFRLLKLLRAFHRDIADVFDQAALENGQRQGPVAKVKAKTNATARKD